jgi:hypothetical protein
VKLGCWYLRENVKEKIAKGEKWFLEVKNTNLLDTFG